MGGDSGLGQVGRVGVDKIRWELRLRTRTGR